MVAPLMSGSSVDAAGPVTWADVAVDFLLPLAQDGGGAHDEGRPTVPHRRRQR